MKRTFLATFFLNSHDIGDARERDYTYGNNLIRLQRKLLLIEFIFLVAGNLYDFINRDQGIDVDQKQKSTKKIPFAPPICVQWPTSH